MMLTTMKNFFTGLNTSPEDRATDSPATNRSINMRDLQLGIDYGTSTSKLVLRDFAAPGGERAYLIGKETDYRFSSDVSCSPDAIFLGSKPTGGLVHGESAIGYESIKMQVADEVKDDPRRFYYGARRAFPAGFCASDFAALSVWLLLSTGEIAARQALKLTNIKLGMTLGIPMSFRADPKLRDAFLKIARTASHLYRTHGPLTTHRILLLDARQILDEAYQAVESAPPIPPEQVVDWIRSEAEAAMLWAFRSPGVPSGPYFKIDIGAGTTNASMFRLVDSPINGQWVRSGFKFFGAFSGPHGMDAVDHALALHLGKDVDSSLDLRAQEDGLLHDGSALNAVTPTFREIRNTLSNAWRLGYPNVAGPNELPHWDQANIFVIGGGSLVAPLRDFVSTHPSGRNISIPRREFDIPSDLYLEDGTRPSEDLLPFAMVAYGLSNLGLAVPEAETPETIPPMATPPTRSRPTHEDIYGDG